MTGQTHARRNWRRSALQIALLNTAALALACPALAQTQPPEEASVSEIVVTGSRIRGVAPVGSALVSVGRDEVLQSGATTTAEILKQVPQITSIGFNAEGSVGAAAPSNITRSTAPNLRGIGPTATLTILDGHRVSSSGTQGQLVDPSFLPPLAIQRVEVIADGASAIYGSDAVAGVVNLVPRKAFQGVEVNARAATGDKYYDYQFGALAGTSWGTGHFVGAVDYLYSDAVETAERDFITDDRRSFGGANGLDITCANPGTATIGGVTYALPAGSGVGVLRSGLTAGTSNRCDVSRLNRLMPEMRRFSSYGYFDQEISDKLAFYVQGFYSRREFETVRTQPFLNAVTVPAANPFRPADVTAGTAVQVSYSLIPDLGRGPATGFSEIYQTLVGLDAKLGEFRLKLSGSYGEGSDIENRVTVNQFFLNQALADTNPATALNVFGGPGNNNPITLRRIFSGRPFIRGVSTLKSLELNGDGPLFELPGGTVRIAAGGEYREESLTADSASVNNATGGVSTTFTENNREIQAGYAELFIPVFGEGNAVPGIRRLDLSLALRGEHYSDFGSTTNPKLGVNWEPLDGLVFRASYGTSFRAPGLSENDPNSSGAGIRTGLVTLANGTRVTQVNLAGGNPDLQPETADTWSAGFDFTPTGIPGLRLSATYFDIAYENQIVDGFGRVNLYLNSPTVYPTLVAFQGSPNFATLRALIEGSGFTPPSAINYAQADLVLVDARRVNVGQVSTNGIDIDFRYRRPTERFGDFTFAISGTRFLAYDSAEAGQPFLDRLNVIAFPAKLAGRVNVGWEYGPFRTNVAANYVNSYINNNSLLVPLVDSLTTFDLDLAYEFGEDAGMAKDLRVAVNVRNVFDTDPPQVDMAGAYDPSKASALGRVVALSLSKRW